MVGRSRKSDIRVGQNTPMPYISSQHFRIYHVINWPEQAAGGSSAPPPAPVLEPWLEDLSQNGTFVNSQPVGRYNTTALKDGDRIELVFASPRAPVHLRPLPCHSSLTLTLG